MKPNTQITWVDQKEGYRSIFALIHIIDIHYLILALIGLCWPLLSYFGCHCLIWLSSPYSGCQWPNFDWLSPYLSYYHVIIDYYHWSFLVDLIVSLPLCWLWNSAFLLPLHMSELSIHITTIYCGTQFLFTGLSGRNLIILLLAHIMDFSILIGLYCRFIFIERCLWYCLWVKPLQRKNRAICCLGLLIIRLLTFSSS